MSTLPPLTHHEILGVVEPFSRRGRRTDLAASDRLQRRLVFQPREHAAGAAVDGQPALPALQETLQLEQPQAGRWRLQRMLHTACGLHAVLEAEGAQPGELLARIEAVPPARQFSRVAGCLLAFSFRAGAAPAAGEPPPLVLRQAETRLAGAPVLTLRMSVTSVSGYAAELALQHESDTPPALPRDLFAVLGSAWDRLSSKRQGWQGSVQLRGVEPRRSREAEARMHAAVEHLVRTLAESPARFHERHWRARWAVVLRGTAPLLVGGAVVGTALWVQRQGGANSSVLAMLANIAPPLLMGLFFLRREMPRIELPRVPRRPPAGAWQPREPFAG